MAATMACQRIFNVAGTYAKQGSARKQIARTLHGLLLPSLWSLICDSALAMALGEGSLHPI
jgi:hypothetical protein